MRSSTSVFDLGGRVAVVTGAASGIGFGIAQTLAEAGAITVIADREFEAALQRAEELTAAGFKATAVRMDVADEASIVRACAEVVAGHGVPWLLVNNAGLQDRQLLLEGTSAEWERVFAVNGRGPFLLIREVARAMVTAKTGGRIVNVASAALVGSMVKGSSIYAASKGALHALSRASALELVEHGITVNTVLPGGVATPGAIAAGGPRSQGPGTRPPPLGLSEPRDIAAAVLFFATPAARRITNQTLAVDAGWSLS